MGYSSGFEGKCTLLITNSLLVFSPVPKHDTFCPILSNLLFSPSFTSSFLSHQHHFHFLGFSWHVSCPASPRSQYQAFHLITVFHLTLVFSNASSLPPPHILVAVCCAWHLAQSSSLRCQSPSLSFCFFRGGSPQISFLLFYIFLVAVVPLTLQTISVFSVPAFLLDLRMDHFA